MASVNKESLQRMYVSEQLSIPDISKLIGLAQSTVRYYLIKFGIDLRSRADGVRAARHKLGAHLKGKSRIFTPQWRANISLGKLRIGDLSAKGTSLKPSGYVEYTRGEHKGRSLHVVAMESHIGRRLMPDEVVHHRDENRSNNDPSNLQLMTRSAHTKHHQGKRHGKC